MRVAFMGRSIRPGASGVGRYAANLVRGIAALLPPESFSVFLPSDAPRGLGRVHELHAPFPTPNEYVRAIWEQTLVPAQTAALACDVYHSPNYILPALLPCRAVVTVHDLAYLDATIHRRKSHIYLSVMTALALARAQVVIAVSEYTRRAIERRYPRTAGRVEVIYEGVDPALQHPSACELTTFRDRLGLRQPYILGVGTVEPRKNLVRLVAAFEHLVREADVPHTLMLVGPIGWKTTALQRAIERSPVRDRIHLLGYVSDRDLACWYSDASVFVYPSLQEGFGLPPLEAMALGAPVVTSDRTALPEVVGDAALLVDPYDVGALGAAIWRVLSDAALAERLRKAGPDRARRFCWSQAARQHVDIYQRVADSCA